MLLTTLLLALSHIGASTAESSAGAQDATPYSHEVRSANVRRSHRDRSICEAPVGLSRRAEVDGNADVGVSVSLHMSFFRQILLTVCVDPESRIVSWKYHYQAGA